MLFRYSTEMADIYMPESFVKIIISKYHYPSLPNSTEMNFLYPSEYCWSDEGNVLSKDKYMSYLQSNFNHTAVILTVMNALHGNEDVAILTSEEEIPTRIIDYFCDFITERYGYISFPFTSMDDITINMRRLSCTTEEGERNYFNDLKIYEKDERDLNE